MPFLIVLTFLLTGANAKDSVTLTAYEQEVLKQTNRIRKDPKSLVPVLKKLHKKFDGKHLYLGPNLRIATKEGAWAVSEAVEALAKTRAAPELEISKPLTLAARDHRNEQSKSGEVGHYGAAGKSPNARIKKYGTPVGKSGENITYGEYGEEGPLSAIIAMVVDDGVPDRGHRRNLFDPEFKKVGIACGKHEQYGKMCVFDFATDVR